MRQHAGSRGGMAVAVAQEIEDEGFLRQDGAVRAQLHEAGRLVTGNGGVR